MIAVSRHIVFRATLRWCAAMAFCFPLKHRKQFWLRAGLMLLPLLALSWTPWPRAAP